MLKFFWYVFAVLKATKLPSTNNKLKLDCAQNDQWPGIATKKVKRSNNKKNRLN